MTATATGLRGLTRVRVRALLVMAALVGASVVAAAPASAQVSGVSIGVTPAFSSPVTVGAQNQAALIQITNGSFGTAGTEPVTITNIRVNASCDAVSPDGFLC